MSLTRDDVVAAACAILDEFGLADVTMRRVGDSLGVRAGALYRHAPNKQTLLAWVADTIVADVPAPDGDDVDAWAHALRSALLAHRDSAELIASARATGLAERDPAAPLASALASRGIDDPDAVAATVLHFVLGHVAEEQARADWERFGSPTTPASATDETFTRGVRIIADGIDAQAQRPR